jgi:hypothetical protein
MLALNASETVCGLVLAQLETSVVLGSSRFTLTVCLLCAAVVVLSPEFVRKESTMRELKIFLERKAKDPSNLVIVLVFYELTVEQCENLQLLYEDEPWPTGIARVDDDGVLKGWVEAVQQLLVTTGAKIEEVRGVSCRVAGGIGITTPGL